MLRNMSALALISMAVLFSLIIPMTLAAGTSPVHDDPYTFGIFLSLSAAAAAVVPATTFITTLALAFGIRIRGSVERGLSWGVAIGIAVIGSYQGLGIFGGVPLSWAVGYGIGIGLAANGIYNIGTIKQILDFARSVIARRDTKYL